ncbi:Zn-dependent alcohol dehydrogenase [Paeniglutamicibacter antarcticus]|uniref:Zn-dependent alcohol dehydrogenase n=1 Tax=Arthrobacter terrae TaxID=2935737 RepID=A0A931CV55_9MICC|nr:Zn-dependent alcohol dehydrogenase [Arthrobacter terrae]MBG0741541.1 Zn-dependent alcohol dehydrogenase [Arthrobacter terrae]
MRAAVLREVPGKFSIENVDLDKPRGEEVRIRTMAAGVCQTELHIMEGRNPALLPTVLGHESAGVVTAIGEDVTHVKLGDHIVTCVSRFCGECRQCLTGHPSLCHAVSTGRAAGAPPALSQNGNSINQFVGLASFAEEMLVHERNTVKIDRDIPFDRAALVGCAVLTGCGAVFNSAQVRAGTTVAVIGCGGVGLNCIQGARIAGALRVIAIDKSAAKLALAKQFGATDVIDASSCDPVAAVRDLTLGGVEYSFEAIGLPSTIEQAIAMLSRGGVTTAIGMIPDGATVRVSGADMMAERRLQGCRMGSNRFRLDVPRLLELYKQGRLMLDELISDRVDLDSVNQACAKLKSGAAARSVIMFE